MWDLCKAVITAYGLIVALAAVLLLVGGCAAAEPAKAAFPEDMRLVCYQGRLVLGSASAGEVVPLPFRCSET